MKQLAVILFAALTTCGGQGIPTSAFHFYSYSSTPPIATPPSTMFSVGFPQQAQGAQDVLPNCHTFGNLFYQWYTFANGVWTPIDGSTPVMRYFTNYYQTSATVQMSKGFAFDMTVAGTLGTNTAPASQILIQSFFWGQSQCFENGPEIGFYRNMQTPGSVTEANTIVFYYGLNVNCFTVGALSSCRDRTTGQSFGPQIQTVTLTKPSAPNSHGTNEWIYSAQLINPNQWTVRITDPFTNKDAIPAQLLSVQSWFESTAQALYSSGLPGFVTMTEQRSSVLGSITDNPKDPLKITSYNIVVR